MGSGQSMPAESGAGAAGAASAARLSAATIKHSLFKYTYGNISVYYLITSPNAFFESVVPRGEFVPVPFLLPNNVPRLFAVHSFLTQVTGYYARESTSYFNCSVDGETFVVAVAQFVFSEVPVLNSMALLLGEMWDLEPAFLKFVFRAPFTALPDLNRFSDLEFELGLFQIVCDVAEAQTGERLSARMSAFELRAALTRVGFDPLISLPIFMDLPSHITYELLEFFSRNLHFESLGKRIENTQGFARQAGSFLTGIPAPNSSLETASSSFGHLKTRQKCHAELTRYPIAWASEGGRNWDSYLVAKQFLAGIKILEKKSESLYEKPKLRFGAYDSITLDQKCYQKYVRKTKENGLILGFMELCTVLLEGERAPAFLLINSRNAAIDMFTKKEIATENIVQRRKLKPTNESQKLYEMYDLGKHEFQELMSYSNAQLLEKCNNYTQSPFRFVKANPAFFAQSSSTPFYKAGSTEINPIFLSPIPNNRFVPQSRLKPPPDFVQVRDYLFMGAVRSADGSTVTLEFFTAKDLQGGLLGHLSGKPYTGIFLLPTEPVLYIAPTGEKHLWNYYAWIRPNGDIYFEEVQSFHVYTASTEECEGIVLEHPQVPDTTMLPTTSSDTRYESFKSQVSTGAQDSLLTELESTPQSNIRLQPHTFIDPLMYNKSALPVDVQENYAWRSIDASVFSELAHLERTNELFTQVLTDLHTLDAALASAMRMRLPATRNRTLEQLHDGFVRAIREFQVFQAKKSTADALDLPDEDFMNYRAKQSVLRYTCALHSKIIRQIRNSLEKESANYAALNAAIQAYTTAVAAGASPDEIARLSQSIRSLFVKIAKPLPEQLLSDLSFYYPSAPSARGGRRKTRKLKRKSCRDRCRSE